MLKTKTKGGGAWVKLADYKHAVAVLIEVDQYLADQPNGNFQGTRDVVIADLTIFENAAALNGDVEPTIIKKAQFSGVGVTSDLEGEEGNQLAYRIEIIPSKKPGHKPFPAWRELDLSVAEKVEAYLERRDAEVKAAMEADLPDFLK